MLLTVVSRTHRQQITRVVERLKPLEASPALSEATTLVATPPSSADVPPTIEDYTGSSSKSTTTTSSCSACTIYSSTSSPSSRALARATRARYSERHKYHSSPR